MIAPVSEEQAREAIAKIVASVDRSQAFRRETMPTTAAALAVIGQAYQRLKDLGWREASYCPKDGSPFAAIEAGSNGVHCCHYSGEWPDGHWWIESGGDLWPSRPTLFRPLDAQDVEPKSPSEQLAELNDARKQAHEEADGQS